MNLSPDLDKLIDRYATMLREYAAFARGVRAEGMATDVEDDPRVTEFTWRLALLGAELDSAFLAETGVSAPVAMAYEPDEDDPDDEDGDESDIEELRLEFVVRGVDDDLVTWLAETGEALAEAVEGQGYDLLEWTNARTPVFPVTADDEDGEDGEDAADGGAADGGGAEDGDAR